MSRKAFTMIELLMVMLIIGIVMAIVVPALGGARQAARRATTTQLLGQINSAASSFQNDQGRIPGVYSVEEMGRASNIAYGLTAMENAMLELIGGIVEPTIGDASNFVEIEIPGTDRSFLVDPGQATGDYFTPDPSNYKPMWGVQQAGNNDHVGKSENDPQLKDVVDAWGNPLLLWVENQYATNKINSHFDFAQESSGDGTSRSRFYGASNAGFLNSTSLGKSGKQQPFDDYNGSLIQLNKNADDLSRTLMGILGHPSFPDNRDQSVEDIVATAPRGGFIAHSAGADGYYFGARDSGSRATGCIEKAGANFQILPLLYGLNFKVSRDSSNDLIDDNGQVETIDRAMAFDDMILSGGN